MSYSEDYVSVDLAVTFVILDTLNIFWLIDWLKLFSDLSFSIPSAVLAGIFIEIGWYVWVYARKLKWLFFEAQCIFVFLPTVCSCICRCIRECFLSTESRIRTHDGTRIHEADKFCKLGSSHDHYRRQLSLKIRLMAACLANCWRTT